MGLGKEWEQNLAKSESWNWNKPLGTEGSGIKETPISDPHRTGLSM